jgi:glycosyltransferase involved in cell wall biosynthesis
MKQLKVSIIIDDSIIDRHHGVRRYLLSISENLKSYSEVSFYKVIPSSENVCQYEKIIFDQDFTYNNGFNESIKLESLTRSAIVEYYLSEGHEKSCDRDYFKYSCIFWGEYLPRTDVCLVGAPWVLSNYSSGFNSSKVYCIGYDAIPIIYSFSNTTDEGLYQFAREHYQGYVKAVTAFDGILAISDASKIQILSVVKGYTDKIFVVPPFLPVGFDYIKPDKNHMVSRDKNSLVLAAPFDERKGFKDIPAIIKNTSIEKITIFGGVRCNIEDVVCFFESLPSVSIEWWPKVSTQDQVNIYSSSSLLIFPSHSEGLGLPVMEALSCGANVLVTDIDPLNKLVKTESILSLNSELNISKIEHFLNVDNTEDNMNYARSSWGEDRFKKKFLNILNK